ncbi:MAG: F0F1 ATP synthase subunit A [Acidimicrobiales bacterium]|nr:F0F1 ATP synthase subunit A [Acidimicrobiales bacterium]
MIFGLEFPPISHVVEWPTLFGDGAFAVNKVVLLMWISAAISFAVMFIGGRKRALVPTGTQNVAESAVDFIQDGIIMETMGPDGLKFTPFLLTLFTFILTCNIWGLIPGVQMPVNARIALPAFLAILVWAMYHVVGIKSQGPIKYFKSATIPPGVPKAILPLVFLIELLGILVTRPLSLAVRLFANLIAGHLLLVTFAVLCQALFDATKVGFVLPFALLVFLSAFEILVAFLQAYIFTILAAVYIGGAMHPEH